MSALCIKLSKYYNLPLFSRSTQLQCTVVQSSVSGEHKVQKDSLAAKHSTVHHHGPTMFDAYLQVCSLGLAPVAVGARGRWRSLGVRISVPEISVRLQLLCMTGAEFQLPCQGKI